MATRRKPTKARKPTRTVVRRAKPIQEEDKDLSAAERRELEQRIKDLDDRTRYLLASSIGSKITLYYNIADDTYSWDEPKSATLFKRKAAAQKIRTMLGSGVKVVECLVDKRGLLVKKSIVK
jgi:hypothetical protein